MRVGDEDARRPANNAMADLTYRNMELVGAPVFSEEAKAFGREIQKNLGVSRWTNPLARRTSG